MRPLALVCALVAAGALAGAADARSLDAGFVVAKDLRSHAVVEVRDAATGRIVATEGAHGAVGDDDSACGDSHHTFLGHRWRDEPGYLVDSGSFPTYLDGDAVLADLLAAHAAWQGTPTTDCADTRRTSAYRATYLGDTAAGASLADGLTRDGRNVVAFRSLAGTVCDGAVACVVAEFKGGSIREADVLFEVDLPRYGYDDRWSTDDTTRYDATGGVFAVVDVATHEWGHFAGLGHVDRSPGLTMFPYIRDGMQTLGLGDVKGIAARY